MELNNGNCFLTNGTKNPAPLEKKDVGELLYPVIHHHYPEVAGKVTGMLLDLPREHWTRLLGDSSFLKQMMKDCVELLDEAERIPEEPLPEVLSSETMEELCLYDSKDDTRNTTIVAPEIPLNKRIPDSGMFNGYVWTRSSVREPRFPVRESEVQLSLKQIKARTACPRPGPIPDIAPNVGNLLIPSERVFTLDDGKIYTPYKELPSTPLRRIDLLPVMVRIKGVDTRVFELSDLYLTPLEKEEYERNGFLPPRPIFFEEAKNVPLPTSRKMKKQKAKSKFSSEVFSFAELRKQRKALNKRFAESCVEVPEEDRVEDPSVEWMDVEEQEWSNLGFTVHNDGTITAPEYIEDDSLHLLNFAESQSDTSSDLETVSELSNESQAYAIGSYPFDELWQAFSSARRQLQEEEDEAWADELEWDFQNNPENWDIPDDYPRQRNFEGVMIGNEIIVNTFDESEVISVPVTLVQWQFLSELYTSKSPFFERYFREYEDKYGVDFMLNNINDYLQTCQYTTGSLEYFKDQLFGTRRYRDEFLDFMDSKRSPVAESEVENVTTQEQNVIFTDQREIEVDQAYTTSQIEPSHQRYDMPETNWSMANVFAKPEIIKTVSWATSDSDNKVLWRTTVPGGTLGLLHRSVLRNFMFFRGHPKLRIQMNTTKFHFGRLLAVYVPMQSKVNYVDQLYSTDALISCPHVMLDAGECNSGILDIPFVHPQSYFNTEYNQYKQYLGEILIIVYNRLGVTTNASKSVDVTIWASYDNAEIHQTSHSHLPVGLVAEAGIEGLVKALPMIAKTVGNVAGMASNCDKPTDPNEIRRWVPNAVSSMNFGDGLDVSNRLSLCPGTATQGSADIVSATADDANLLNLMKIPTRLKIIDWTTANPGSVFLWGTPVCPTVCSDLQRHSVATEPDVYGPTLLAYIARGFKFWRGSIRYKFQVIASPMHTGRLMISMRPGNWRDSNSLLTGNFANYILDLQERKEVEIVIPYMSTRPWLRCDALWSQDRAYNSDIAKPLAIGPLAVYVVNRLVSPDASAQTVQINVLVSAGDDFQLAFPTEFAYYEGSGNVIKKAMAESLVGAEAVTTREEEGVIYLGKQAGPVVDMSYITMGENAMSLPAVCRRYYKVYENVMDNIKYSDFFCFPNSPTLSSVNKSFGSDKAWQFRPHLAHFSELFTFWRGSLRYKLILDRSAFSAYEIKVFHVPGVFNKGQKFYTSFGGPVARREMGALESCGVMIGVNNVQGSLEFEIPFYTPMTQLLTLPDVDKYDIGCATGLVVVMINQPFDQANIRLELYQAAGDDFSLNLLRAAPRMQFKADTEYNKQIEDNANWIWNTSDGDDIASKVENIHITEERPRFAEMMVGSAIKNIVMAPVHAYNRISSVTRTTERTMESLGTLCDVTTELIHPGATTSSDEQSESDDDDNVAPNVMMELLRDAIKELAGPLQAVGSISSFVVSVSNLVSGFNSFIQATSFPVKVCAIVTIVSELLGSALKYIKGKLYNCATAILKAINEYRQGNRYSVGNSEFLDFAPALLATLGVGAVAVGWKSIPDDKQTNDLIKNLNDRLRLFNGTSLAMSNIKGLWHSLKDLVEGIVEWVLLQTAPHLLSQMKLQKGFQDVERFAQWIQRIYDSNYVDRSLWDVDFRNEVMRWSDYAEKLQGQLLSGKIGREGVILRELITKCFEMRGKIEKRHYACPFRVDPFCVCLHGPPGCGKSATILDLANDIMDEMGYPQYNRLCAVNPSEQFFTENYDNQTAIYIDDFSAFEKEEQYQNFFSLKTNTLHPLNMAFKKGKYFKSDFIFMTTNIPWPKPNCMSVHNALWRRRDCLIEVGYVPEKPKDPTKKENMQYRFSSPLKEEHADSHWMDYDTMKRVVIERGKLWMQSQRRYVQQALLKAGYEVPEGLDLLPPVDVPFGHTFMNLDEYHDQAVREMTEFREQNHLPPDEPPVTQPLLRVANVKVLPYLDMEAALNDTFWNMYYYSDWLQWLEWVEVSSEHYGGFYQLKHNTPEEIRLIFDDDLKNIVERGKDFQQELWRITKTHYSTMNYVNDKIKIFKNWLWQKWEEWKLDYPWIAVLETWPVKLAGAMLALSGIVVAGAAIVHKCLCSTQRFFGWRCFKCGRWPQLENCQDKEWMLKEWQRVYGMNRGYEDFKVMTLDEEKQFSELNQEIVPTEPFIGTKIKYSEGGPYSNIVKGMTKHPVFAHAAPYNVHVAGSKAPTIFANSSQKVDNLIQQRLIPYTYRLRVYSKENVPMGLNGLAIGQRKMLIPAHLFAVPVEEFFISYHGNWMRILFEEDRVTKIPHKDLIIYDMPVQFHQHRSMLRHFISEKELGKVSKTEGYLVRKSDETNTIILMPYKRITAVRSVVDYQDPFYKGQTHYVQGSWKYETENMPGSCGSALISNNDNLSGQILGVHIAGDGYMGWSTLITREMLEPMITAEIGTPLPAVVEAAQLIPKGHFASIGRVAKDKGAFSSSKSQIIPTEIHGLIRETTCGPSVLRNNDPRLSTRMHVSKTAFEKYGQIPIQFNPNHVRMVFNSLEAEIQQWEVPRPPQLLTDEECVLGIPELEGFDRLPMNTSPGWPYTTTREAGTIGKSYLFDVDTGKIIDKELQINFDSRKALAKRGERCVSVWTCCLKDERRPLAKIASGSTRMFSIPPVDLSLLTRQYSLDFSIAIKNNRHTSFTKVGIDPQSLEWTNLYYYLAEFSPYVIAGDFSRFDGTLPPDLSFKFYEHCDNYYKFHGKWTEEDRKVRMTLADEAVHTVHIMGQEIIVNHTGNESGDPNTVNKNSFVNYYYMALSWLQLATEHAPDMATMGHFRKNVRLAIYGDDNLLAVKPEVLEWYNQETISKFLEKYGIIYTNESKTGITKYKKLDEATFLKCSFHDHELINGIKVARMSETTMYELLNWTRIAPDQEELLESNCNDALRFAYFYGQKYFENFRSNIMSALKQKGLKMDIMTFDDFHFWFLYVIGRLPTPRKAECFLEAVSKNGNGAFSKLMNKAVLGVPYVVLSHLGLLRKENNQERTDSRYAIAIPSGEGKSWLARHYPHLFVDHDELLLPAANRLLKENGISLGALRKMFDEEKPINDRRVLLVHHPDNTKRQMLGSFVLPKPSWIRANAYQRVRLQNPKRMERDQRNEYILKLVKEKEPQLF